MSTTMSDAPVKPASDRPSGITSRDPVLGTAKPDKSFANVTIVGAGVIGREIGLHAAAYGRTVVLLDRDEAVLTSAATEMRQNLSAWAGLLAPKVSDPVDAVLARITGTTDPAVAVGDADLIIEAIPEVLSLKRDVLRDLEQAAPPSAVLVTTSSYFTPGQLCRKLTRPERFAALHFHSPVSFSRAVDICGHARTTPEVVTDLDRFVRELDLIPIRMTKEWPGYVFNSLLQVLLIEALTLHQRDIASPEQIDRAWMAVTHMPLGPFGMIDKIGLSTVCHALRHWGPVLKNPQMDRCAELLEQRIASGRTGMSAGRGFYDYPQPLYARPEFLTGTAAPSEAAARPFGMAALPSNPARTASPAPTVSPVGQASVERATCQVLVWTKTEARLSPRVRKAFPSRGTTVVIGLPPGTLPNPGYDLGHDPGQDAARSEDRHSAHADAHAPTIVLEAASQNHANPCESVWETLARTLETSSSPCLHLVLGPDGPAGTSDRTMPPAESLRGVMDDVSLGRGTWRAVAGLRAWLAHLRRFDATDEATLTVVDRLDPAAARSSRPQGTTPATAGLLALARSVVMESLAEGTLGPALKLVHLASDVPTPAGGLALRTEAALASRLIVRGTREETIERFAEAETWLTRPDTPDRTPLDLDRHLGRLAVVASGPSNRSPGTTVTFQPTESPQSGTAWIVTGGGRGVTARCVERLAIRFGVAVHLVGRTPRVERLGELGPRIPTAWRDRDATELPATESSRLRADVMRAASEQGLRPDAAWEPIEAAVELANTLKRLKVAGCDVTYHQADVADPTAAPTVVAAVQAAGRPITGFVHGAGIERTRRLEKKTEADVQATVAIKAEAFNTWLRVLLADRTGSVPLRHVVAFGSLAGVFGGVGQADYAFANAALAAATARLALARPELQAVCLHWPGWGEVGMASRTGSRYLLARSGHTLMSVAEGVTWFERAVTERLVDGEGRTVTDWIIARPEEIPAALRHTAAG